MSNDKLISLDKFLDAKEDFSHLLVHLTRKGAHYSAKYALAVILEECTLEARNPWCIWVKNLKDPANASLRQHFNVVCFTETPLEQISALLQKLEGRQYQPDPYGLVFRKSYIREKGGNPVFYTTREIAEPLHELFERQENNANSKVCKLLALTTLCEEGNDWHWEREWRIVGDLKFEFGDIYCGLCPEQDISFFRDKYKQVRFIDPFWGANKILDELVKK